MIEIKLRSVHGFEDAVDGARNAYRSWDKSDSKWVKDDVEDRWNYILGDADERLLTKLAHGGHSHAKPRRAIDVRLDITAPLYWWKEFDTYKVGTIAMSESTMHNVCDKPFEMSDFSHEHLGNLDIGIIKPGNIPAGKYVFNTEDHLKYIIEKLNDYRNGYLYYKENNHSEMAKLFWWQIIQLLPSSYNQHRTVVLNYENLGAMYYDRVCHKLDEWRIFCDWIVNYLPHPEIIMGTALPHYHHANNIMYDDIWEKLSDILTEGLRSDMSKEQLMKIINSSKTPENGGIIL